MNESLWTTDELISAAVTSAYSLSPQNVVAITPPVDDVVFAYRIVWNAEFFGWNDLGWSAMLAWHLALTLPLAYVTIMTTYTMCAPPGLAGPTRIVQKLDASGVMGLAVGWLVLVIVTTIVIGLVYCGEGTIGVVGQSWRFIHIVSLKDGPSEHRWAAALEAMPLTSGSSAMVFFLELLVETCTL